MIGVMNRYSVIAGKLPREVVLLRGLPCIWGRCTFCDYILDNTTDLGEIRRVAEVELAKVTGRYSRLEVINSGSVQELPPDVRATVRDVLHAKGIHEFICESHWAYRQSFMETRAFFGVPTRLKIGVETFDHHLRNNVLGKGMYFELPGDVARFTDTICLLVGFKGQTRDQVRRDIDILLTQFRFGCVNLFTPNSLSQRLLDPDIKAWFGEEYAWLAEHPTIEVLWKNTDFGVGG